MGYYCCFYRDPCLLTIQFTRNAEDKTEAKIENNELYEVVHI